MRMSAGHDRGHGEAVQPVLLDDAETMTTKAPVGPPICTRVPPRSGDQEAGDNGGVEARAPG